jgi:two-component system response regulator MtrA
MAKIIFCEDEARIQKLIRVIMRSTDHEVFVAADGVEGLTLIERERPDIVFTDISMPDCDGFQLAEAMQANPALANIPLIFVTAFAQQPEREEGFRHGAVGYLIKPFSPTELREMIDAFVIAGLPR